MPETPEASAHPRFQEAMVRFDRANADDPNHEPIDGVDQPRELVYGRRMSERLQRFAPRASEPLRLAARAQHIRRWTIPRSDFKPGRDGYREWRTKLGRFHAETAREILHAIGYPPDIVSRVEALLRKERLKVDPDAQTLEDVACLVFLEHYAETFASGQDEDKLVEILGKMWRKMSESGRKAAAETDLNPTVRALVDRAAAGHDSPDPRRLQ